MTNEWFKIREIMPDVYLIEENERLLEVKMYLVVGSTKCLLIDTGFGVGDLKGLIRQITDLPIIVVNTHGHPDHVHGNAQFSTIYISSEDLCLVKNCFTREYRFLEYQQFINSHQVEDFNLKNFSSEAWINATLNEIVTIKEGDLFDLGNKTIEVIAMSGHTPGSVLFLAREDRVLFSGDSVLAGQIWMHLDHSMPLHIYLASLEKLQQRMNEFDWVLPAHAETLVSPEIINEFITGIKTILSGESRGIPYQTFAGDGLIAKFNNCAVIYNEKKL